jgi:hypothetical protein
MADRYLQEKLRDAANSVTDTEGSPQDRLLRASDPLERLSFAGIMFPDPDGARDFAQIMDALTKYDEATEEAGSIPTTLAKMSTDEAQNLCDRIVKLALRYGDT